MALVIHSIEHSTDHSTEHSIEHSIERFIEHSTEPQGSLSLVVEVLILVCVSNRCAAAAARVARPSATSSCAATESVHAHARAAAMCASGSAARESALRAPKCATGSCRAATTSARHFPFKHTWRSLWAPFPHHQIAATKSFKQFNRSSSKSLAGG